MGQLFANPLESPELVNTITVANISFGPFGDYTGKFELEDSDGRPFKWDTKDAPGTQGATITYRGSRPSKGKFKFYFWTAQQIIDFDRNVLPLFQIDATKKTPKPVDVLQLMLASIDVFAVTTETLGEGSVYVHEGAGLYSYTIAWLEYAPAKKKNATTTPSGTVTAKPPTPSQTFPDAQDRELASLLAKAAQP